VRRGALYLLLHARRLGAEPPDLPRLVALDLWPVGHRGVSR